MSYVQGRFTLGEELCDVWRQAQDNHERYSQMGDDESDIRFFALALAGEAGELANFVRTSSSSGPSGFHPSRCASCYGDTRGMCILHRRCVLDGHRMP